MPRHGQHDEGVAHHEPETPWGARSKRLREHHADVEAGKFHKPVFSKHWANYILQFVVGLRSGDLFGEPGHVGMPERGIHSRHHAFEWPLRSHAQPLKVDLSCGRVYGHWWHRSPLARPR